MRESFRQSMTWLHTWAGVVCAGLLFAMFWTGTLTVFDKEIDRWMQPSTRAVVPAEVSLDRMVVPLLRRVAGESDQFYVNPPTERTPTLRVGYSDREGKWVQRHIDPRTGAEIPLPESLGGSGFFFPFHFSFHITWMGLGYWIAGFLAMAMLVLLVSGVVVHRKIIAEFFVFRPKKNARRATLDLHNLTSLLALPFHIIMPLSGLFIFYAIYLPWSVAAPYGGNVDRHYDEVGGNVSRPATGVAAPLASLDAMVQRTERLWSERAGQPVTVDHLTVRSPFDEAGTVSVRHVFSARQVTMDKEAITYDAATGEVLADFTASPVKRLHAFIAGIHWMQWSHWPLRWLMFGSGLAGCVMIATGLLFWLRAREGRHAKPSAGFRTVEAMTIGSITGIVAATGAFFVANRILPDGSSLLGESRAALEVWAFCIVWLASFAHAVWRRSRAWVEQCWCIAALAVTAFVLNATTTGDHILAAARDGLWAVAGMDLMLLAAALLAAQTALKLRSRSPVGSRLVPAAAE